MIRYIALLRGVNLVGRSTLKMAHLRAIAGDLNLGSARTWLASGNLLFTSNDSEESLRAQLEESLKRHMARDVRVMVRTAEEMNAVATANPFADMAPSLVQAFFLNGAPPLNLLDTVKNRVDERIVTGVREVYVAYGQSGIGLSRLRIPEAEDGTARNMNTVRRLAELAMEIS